jgi:prevent-host-death family protein
MSRVDASTPAGGSAARASLGPRPRSSIHRTKLGPSPCLTCDTVSHVNEVTIRELRNQGGKVVDRVMKGERVTVTRGGKPVAELRPLPSKGLTARALLERWRRLPVVDAHRFRADIDAVLDRSV